MVLDHHRVSIAIGDGGVDCEKMGCVAQTPHEVKKAKIYSGKRAGVSTKVADNVKTPERGVRELRQTKESLRKASAYFAQAELDLYSSDDRVR